MIAKYIINWQHWKDMLAEGHSKSTLCLQKFTQSIKTNKRSTKEEATWVRSGGINSTSDKDKNTAAKNAGRRKKGYSGCEQVKPKTKRVNQASVSERGRPKLKQTKRVQGRVRVGARKGMSVGKNERKPGAKREREKEQKQAGLRERRGESESESKSEREREQERAEEERAEAREKASESKSKSERERGQEQAKARASASGSESKSEREGEEKRAEA
eukprot:5863765-Pleurochrysis_carterae.AAC.1